MRMMIGLLLSGVATTAVYGDPPNLPTPISPQAGAVKITDQPKPTKRAILQFFQSLPQRIERIHVKRTVPVVPTDDVKEIRVVPPLPKPLSIRMQPLPVQRIVHPLPTLHGMFHARPITATFQQSKARQARNVRLYVDRVESLRDLRGQEACEDRKQSAGLEFQTATITLKNISAKTALQKINKQVLGQTPPPSKGKYTGQLKIELSFRKNGPRNPTTPTIIVDTKGNALHVIATPKQLGAIKKCVKEIDQSPKQYVFEIRVREVVNGKPGKVISAPKITTLVGRSGQVQIAGPGNIIEINAVVKPTPSPNTWRELVGRRKVHPHPTLRDRQIRPASATKAVDEESEPEELPAPQPQSEPQPEQQTEAEQPAESQRVKAIVYSVADRIVPVPAAGEKLKENKQLCKANAEALATVIRTTIRPDSWSERGGDCAIVYYPASLSLVVRQTENGHKQVAALLESLRNIERSNKK